MSKEEPSKNEVTKPTILFDGICSLCNHAVLSIIRRDSKAAFRFASLQSASGLQLLQQFGLSSTEFGTIVLIEGNRYYTKSTAVLKIFKKLDGLWPLLYMFILVPRSFRDRVYGWIARNRYKWFGKKDQCMMPTPELKERFLE
jgi:predicted DCC family thiol-disulfide oxidoreductase YuxK